MPSSATSQRRSAHAARQTPTPPVTISVRVVSSVCLATMLALAAQTRTAHPRRWRTRGPGPRSRTRQGRSRSVFANPCNRQKMTNLPLGPNGDGDEHGPMRLNRGGGAIVVGAWLIAAADASDSRAALASGLSLPPHTRLRACKHGPVTPRTML